MALKQPYIDLLPPLATGELEALRADILANGVRDPIIIDEEGNILDGHNRYSIDPNAPTRLVSGLSPAEKEAFVIRCNLTRRNLSPDQKREVAKKQRVIALRLRESDPKRWTQQAVADVLGVDRSLVSMWQDTSNVKTHIACIDARVKLGEAARAEVLRRIEGGETQVQVAADFGVTQQAIALVIKKASAKNKGDAVSFEPSSGIAEGDFLESLAGRKFSTVYADPPWQYGNQGTRASTDNHYPTMPIEEICALPVSEVCHEKALLYIWTTNGFLEDTLTKVLPAWGFTFKSSMVWVKPQMGIGNYVRNSHEFLLIANRGGLIPNGKSQMSWIQADRKKHSHKPDLFRHAVEKMGPGPRLEMFARQAHEGWTAWGNEVLATEASFL